MDRVLRRGDQERAPDRDDVDPRRTAGVGDRVRRRCRTDLQVLRLQVLWRVDLHGPWRWRVALEPEVPAVPAVPGELPAGPAVAAGIRRAVLRDLDPVVDPDRLPAGHPQHVRVVVRPPRAREAHLRLRPVPHSGDRHRCRRVRRRGAQLPQHLPGPGRVPAEHHRGDGLAFIIVVARRGDNSLAAPADALAGASVGQGQARRRPGHHHRGRDLRDLLGIRDLRRIPHRIRGHIRPEAHGGSVHCARHRHRLLHRRPAIPASSRACGSPRRSPRYRQSEQTPDDECLGEQRMRGNDGPPHRTRSSRWPGEWRWPDGLWWPRRRPAASRSG